MLIEYPKYPRVLTALVRLTTLSYVKLYAHLAVTATEVGAALAIGAARAVEGS